MSNLEFAGISKSFGWTNVPCSYNTNVNSIDLSPVSTGISKIKEDEGQCEDAMELSIIVLTSTAPNTTKQRAFAKTETSKSNKTFRFYDLYKLHTFPTNIIFGRQSEILVRNFENIQFTTPFEKEPNLHFCFLS